MHNIETIVRELIQAPGVAHHGFKSRHFRRGDGPIDRANAHSVPIQSLSVAGPIFRRSAQIQNSTRLVLLKDFRNDSSKKLKSTLAKSVIQPVGTKVFARIDHGRRELERDVLSHLGNRERSRIPWGSGLADDSHRRADRGRRVGRPHHRGTETQRNSLASASRLVIPSPVRNLFLHAAVHSRFLAALGMTSLKKNKIESLCASVSLW